MERQRDGVFWLGVFPDGRLSAFTHAKRRVCTAVVGKNQVGLAFGFVETINNLALILTPVLAGLLTIGNPLLVFMVSAGVLALCLPLTVWFRTAGRRASQAVLDRMGG